MKIIKGDFLELTFVGKVKESGQIFDLNDEKVAKEEKIYDPKASYEPLIVCVGKRDVVQGLDESLEGKEVGKTYTVDILPENAFGKKNAKLFKLVPASLFKKENIQPVPGLQITADNMIGTIKTVSGGRILVDFNHPLSGREITYKFTINKKVVDDKEKIGSIIKLVLNIKNVLIKIEEKTAKIEVELPNDIQKMLTEKILDRIPNIKKVEFSKKKE